MSRVRPLPLRLTLVAALVALSGLGLLASGVAVTSALQGSLLARTDQDLRTAAQTWAKPPGAGRELPPPDAPSSNRPPSPFYVRVVDPDGRERFVVNDESTAPALPGEPVWEPQTVGSADGSDVRWRVVSTRSAAGLVTTVGVTRVSLEGTVELEVFDGPGIPEVLGDDARLRQVLGNLVTNALTHTPADARVTVRVGTAGPDAVLEVVDTGPGLSEADRARVFERFYRADVSRARSSGGSGLGLSIVAALVAAHGGRVEVESAPGAGSTFRVLIPRMPVE